MFIILICYRAVILNIIKKTFHYNMSGKIRKNKTCYVVIIRLRTNRLQGYQKLWYLINKL